MTVPRDMMRGVITLLLIGGFMFALGALFRIDVPEGNRDLVNFMLGQLSIMASAAVAYHIGTSKSSSDKNAVIAGMADGPSATGKVDDPVHVMPEMPEAEFGR